MPSPQRLPFANLTPDRILDAVESAGWSSDGRLLALNSFENRVYQIGIEDGAPVVAKFYRPGRWSDEAILEEHGFSEALAADEIPVVAPLKDAAGRSLFHWHEFRFAVFPKRPGRAPELEDEATLEWLGRFIGRIHRVGSHTSFVHRPRVDIASYGEAPLAYLLRAKLLPQPLRASFEAAARHALERVRDRFRDAGAVRAIRLHADCHAGNVLWTPEGPHFVDFDDCRMGPAIQDLWMLLAGDRAAMTRQLGAILEGYRMFRELDPAEIVLIEPLRTLRMIHYAAWLGERWSDPAFPAAFPWFGTERYWQDQVLALKEQMAAMDEPPLAPA
ncbi:MAG: serine/threonine protein kinase [Betaproteobacteria bacterium]|nr:MAG: serine/threonine protein kinase [Betaproteobacteria bacterium]